MRRTLISLASVGVLTVPASAQWIDTITNDEFMVPGDTRFDATDLALAPNGNLIIAGLMHEDDSDRIATLLECDGADIIVFKLDPPAGSPPSSPRMDYETRLSGNGRRATWTSTMDDWSFRGMTRSTTEPPTTELPGAVETTALGISPDGSTIGGFADTDAAIWEGPPFATPDPLASPAGSYFAEVTGITLVNSTVRAVGYSFQSGQQPVLWDGGTAELLDVGSWPGGLANAISGDGNWVAGEVRDGADVHGAIWNPPATSVTVIAPPSGRTTLRLLDTMPSFYSTLRSTGPAAVGTATDAQGNCSAVLYDVIEGARLLSDALVNEFGLSLGGLTLESAIAIHVDDNQFTRIVGHATGPLGDTIYVVGLPPAGAACAPDLAPPAGVLDAFDVIEYLGLFDAQDPGADLAAPMGVFDVFDVIEYLGLFDAGCS